MDIANWFNFSGQTALVAGGAGAMGREVVLAFARCGASLIVVDIDAARLSAVKGEVEALGRPVLAKAVDLRDGAAVEGAVAEGWERFGAIDILVQPAAIDLGGPSADFPGETYDRMFDINVKGLWLMCQAVGRRMLERGYGRIVNYVSNAAFRGGMNHAVYPMTKAAIVSMTKSLAVEWARHGITVNAVAPGPTLTPMSAPDHADPVKRAKMLAWIPMGDFPPIDATVGPVLFLASREARWLTGQVLFADGGRNAT